MPEMQIPYKARLQSAVPALIWLVAFSQQMPCQERSGCQTPRRSSSIDDKWQHDFLAVHVEHITLPGI
jgi:hypothetical protein